MFELLLDIYLQSVYSEKCALGFVCKIEEKVAQS